MYDQRIMAVKTKLEWLNTYALLYIQYRQQKHQKKMTQSLLQKINDYIYDPAFSAQLRTNNAGLSLFLPDSLADFFFVSPSEPAPLPKHAFFRALLCYLTERPRAYPRHMARYFGWQEDKIEQMPEPELAATFSRHRHCFEALTQTASLAGQFFLLGTQANFPSKEAAFKALLEYKGLLEPFIRPDNAKQVADHLKDLSAHIEVELYEETPLSSRPSGDSISKVLGAGSISSESLGSLAEQKDSTGFDFI